MLTKKWNTVKNSSSFFSKAEATENEIPSAVSQAGSLTLFINFITFSSYSEKMHWELGWWCQKLKLLENFTMLIFDAINLFKLVVLKIHYQAKCR